MRNCGFIASFLCALAIFAVSAVIAFGTLDGATPGGGGMLGKPLGGSGDSLFISILVRNASVVLSLYAGVISIGIIAMVGIASLGFLIGASTAAAANEVGLTMALWSVSGYAVVEILAYLLAAAAGLLPVSTAVLTSGPPAEEKVVTRYLAPLRQSLVLLAVSLVLVVVGAGLEAAIIQSRNG
ncbi:stage II sporulation protein M [Cutibacterium sp. V947]|uniref:stage II sporulation protein M n=1 Tax=unclassified Cutibacterium TaxID=2649671 RepID=UPI003EDFD7C4